LSFHLPGENSPIGSPFVFPHQDWLLVHFLHIFAAKNRSTWVITKTISAGTTVFNQENSFN